ncbi:MAG: hypothetical protein AAGI38_04905 [Bacteroidota bacterium]
MKIASYTSFLEIVGKSPSQMKYVLLIFSLLVSCAAFPQQDVPRYHQIINEAELLICEEAYTDALTAYGKAFSLIELSFGEDLHNAALVANLAGNTAVRDQYLQQLIDYAKYTDQLKAKYVPQVISSEEWGNLIAQRQIRYDDKLLQVAEALNEKDQMFRPDYEHYDDTINAIRKVNLAYIYELIEENSGLPSHPELGFGQQLSMQPHFIVLHHTAQRRSGDKSVTDLEPLLWEAVNAGRFDPELAIRYLNYQQDREKGAFEVYPIWQYRHPSLPDSLNEQIWTQKLSEAQISAANQIRANWMANSLEEISVKSAFLSRSKWPFIFTSVQKSVMKMASDMDAASALMMYEAITMKMVKYGD